MLLIFFPLAYTETSASISRPADAAAVIRALNAITVSCVLENPPLPFRWAASHFNAELAAGFFAFFASIRARVAYAVVSTFLLDGGVYLNLPYCSIGTATSS